MKNHPLPYFNQIDITTLQEYYSVETTLNNTNVSLDINFEKSSIDEDDYEDIKIFLENISKFNEQNKSLIENDFKENGEAYDYINFYLDELDQDELSNIIDIDIDDRKNQKEKLLLNKLRLVRVGLYPDGKHNADYFGVFDYSIDIDGEPCNQLLVVKTNEMGELDHLTWES